MDTRSVPDSTLPGMGGDEPKLLAGLRSGDNLAFERLVRTQGPRLLAVARRFLQSEEDAKDALQDAFLSVFRSIQGFEGSSKLSTWLHRIVVNACLMKLRARQSKGEQSIEDLLPRFLDDGHQAEPAVEWGDSPYAKIEREETRALVRRSIDRLPDGYRSVLLLRDIEGLDTEETAKLLGLNENTVKIRLHRARQALRCLLDPYLRSALA